MTSQDDIKNVLTALLSGIDQDNRALYQSIESLPALQQAAAAITENDAEDFYYSLIHPLSNMVDGLLSKHLPNNHKGHFLFKHASFIEQHFKKLIEKYEGSPCCADKSRTIIRSLARHFQTGKEIAFDYTQQYTYHLPKTVFTTHEAIITFFDALYRLYYGNCESYLQAIERITASHTAHEHDPDAPKACTPAENREAAEKWRALCAAVRQAATSDNGYASIWGGDDNLSVHHRWQRKGESGMTLELHWVADNEIREDLNAVAALPHPEQGT